MSDWFVYMLRCADNSLYTGVTTDVERRVLEHNAEKSVTKYTRVRQPVSVVYQEKAESRSEACKREAQLKKLIKKDKEMLVEGREVNG
ncbi:MAG: GIY-YIG nuclease family protein [Thiotrichaceae bacterium]|nr:GIY-YIG nuclease family protein [Thiotrichaceae bacterium]